MSNDGALVLGAICVLNGISMYGWPMRTRIVSGESWESDPESAKKTQIRKAKLYGALSGLLGAAFLYVGFTS